MYFRRFSDSYTLIVSLFIIIFNALFYVIVRPLVLMIGYRMKTSEEMLVSLTVFGCLFVDMILFPLITGANLTEYYSEDFDSRIFVGTDTDFGSTWYLNAG